MPRTSPGRRSKRAPAGVKLVIEPINHRDMPGYFLNTQAQGAAVVEAIGRDRLGLQFDVYHVQITEGDITKRMERHMPVIAHMQIADVPARNEPGTGEIGWEFVFRRMDELGYRRLGRLRIPPGGRDTRRARLAREVCDLRHSPAGPRHGGPPVAVRASFIRPSHIAHVGVTRPRIAERKCRMSDELIFYTNPMSRGRIVRWMLEEVGQPYRTEVLDYGTTMKAPAYLAINPMGKVPALRHGDTVVTEAAAICAYLADVFPGRRPGAAAGRPAARPLLPLAVLCRRPAGGRLDQPGAGLRDPAGARADGGLRQLRRRAATRWKARSAHGPYLVGDASPPPTSMSARNSASACGSA